MFTSRQMLSSGKTHLKMLNLIVMVSNVDDGQNHWPAKVFLCGVVVWIHSRDSWLTPTIQKHALVRLTGTSIQY